MLFSNDDFKHKILRYLKQLNLQQWVTVYNFFFI
jgi:hypothetical protein